MLTKNLRISNLSKTLAKRARRPAGANAAAPLAPEFMPVHFTNADEYVHLNKEGIPVENYNKQVIDIQTYDQEVMELVNEEAERQRRSIDLIASSNIPIAGVNE